MHIILWSLFIEILQSYCPYMELIQVIPGPCFVTRSNLLARSCRRRGIFITFSESSSFCFFRERLKYYSLLHQMNILSTVIFSQMAASRPPLSNLQFANGNGFNFDKCNFMMCEKGLNISHKSPLFTSLHNKSFKYTVGKREIARYEQFLFFQQCFSKICHFCKG